MMKWYYFCRMTLRAGLYIIFTLNNAVKGARIVCKAPISQHMAGNMAIQYAMSECPCATL